MKKFNVVTIVTEIRGYEIYVRDEKIVEAETQDIQCHAGKIIKSITESKLNICNPSDKNKASTLIRQYLNNTNLTKEEYTQLMEEVLNQLSMII
jgi:hypothetical protein